MLTFLGRILDITKKIVLLLAVYFAVINLYYYFTAKDAPLLVDQSKQTRKQIYAFIENPNNSKTDTEKVGMIFYRTTVCMTLGEACTNNPEDGDKNFDRSLMGFVTNLMVLPYQHPPASGIAWMQSGLENAGFVPKSYAAEGVGFASIKPYQNIWKIFRDFTYLLLVLILIAIGFMIMFRIKVNPQTVITLENSLPRIVIALFLITFSYAIAGFLIDMMYASMVIGISIISKANVGPLNPDPAKVQSLQNRFVGARLNELWPYGGNPMLIGGAMVQVLPGIVRDLLKGIGAAVLSLFLTSAISYLPNKAVDVAKDVGGQVSGQALTFGAGGGISIGGLPQIPVRVLELIIFTFIFPFAAGFLLGLIFILTLLFLMFRIFFMVLVAYMKALILIIFSPFYLMLEAIPGRKAFTNWIRRLVAELLVFPLVVLFMLIGNVITYTPTTDGSFKPPFLYNMDPSAFTALLGMGLTLLIPDFIKKMKEIVGGKPSGISLGPAAFFGGAAALGGGALGSASKLGSFGYYFSHIGNVPFIGKTFQGITENLKKRRGGGGGGGSAPHTFRPT